MMTAKASLRIMGEFEIGALSEEIGLMPTYSHKKGEIGPIKTVFESDMWRIDSPLEKSATLEQHLNWFVDHLETRYAILKSLATRYRIDVFCSVTAEEQCGLTLSPKALSIFHELQIKMEISLILH